QHLLLFSWVPCFETHPRPLAELRETELPGARPGLGGVESSSAEAMSSASAASMMPMSIPGYPSTGLDFEGAMEGMPVALPRTEGGAGGGGGSRGSKGPRTKRDDEASYTTVMLRNIPNKYTRQMLIDQLHSLGFLGDIDYLYLPIDFANRCNVGYCFVNLRTSVA
ncbi:unnamed protein product, partial [Polarella glacialis]